VKFATSLGGYSFERAYAELEWLLEDDRWKTVGPGFSDINAFLGTLNFADFRITAERRKKIASRLAAIEASQRATARMLGVNHVTIRKDLAGEKSPPPPQKPKETRPDDEPIGEKSPPTGDTPAAPTGLLQSPEVTASAARHMGELQAAIGSAADAGVPEKDKKGAESERPPAADPDEGAECAASGLIRGGENRACPMREARRVQGVGRPHGGTRLLREAGE
jgi:hypothetical protein